MRIKTPITKILLVAMSIVFALALIVTRQSNIGSTYASYNSAVSFTNSNFTSSSYTSANKPYSPSSWTLATGSDDAGTEKGVIKLNESAFSEYSTNPGVLDATSSDQNILMIKSKDGATRAGYTNSSSITLSANGYFIIKVLVYTDSDNNGASIYVSGMNKTLYIEDINTSSTWKTAYFYLTTSEFKSESVKLELWLGAKTNKTTDGKVFFDNITISQVSEDKYVQETSTVRALSAELDLKSDNKYIAVANGNFEDTTNTQWVVDSNAGGEKVHGIGDVSSNSVVGIEGTAPGLLYTAAANTKALYINNKTASYTSYKSTTPITIAQHGYYRLSVYAKTVDVSTGAYLGIKEATSDTNAITGSYSSVKTTATNSSLNGYTEYSLYIEGNPYKDVNFYITLGLGTTETTQSGLVVFDNVTLMQIDYSTYSSYSSSSNAKSVTAYSSSDIADTTSVLNGAFNFAQSDEDVTYPLAPKSWTSTNDVTNSGIININQNHFNSKNYPFSNPGTTGYPGSTNSITSTTNNVLVIGAAGNFVEYKSSNISLSTNSYYAISLYAKTQGADAEQGGLNIRLVNDAGIVLSSIANQFSESNWTVYTMYIRTSSASQTANLIVGLGSSYDKATSGYVFVDNVEVITSTKEVFDAKESNHNATEQTTNLVVNRFNNYTNKNSDDTYTPSLLKETTTKPEGTRAGIVKIEELTSNSPLLPTDAIDTSVLMINNAQDKGYGYTNNISISLTANSQYRVSVWVKTLNLSTESAENVEDNKLYKGANFTINNTDDKFSAITTDSNENNGWEQYTYYITASNDQTLTVTLGLGLDVATSGIAYFDDLTVELLDTSFSTDEVEVNDNTIICTVTGEEEEEEPVEDTPDGQQVNFWILIPTLALAVVLLFAIISIGTRKIKFNKKVKVKQGKYDRSTTLNDDVVRRELAKQREEKLNTIKAQREDINKTIEKNKLDYEASLSKESVSAKKERLFSKYAKTRNKLQAQLDKLSSVEAYLLDPANIKAEEQREIRSRQAQLNKANKETIKAQKAEVKAEDKSDDNKVE